MTFPELQPAEEHPARRSVDRHDVGGTVLLLVAHLGLLVISALIGTVMSMGEPCPPPGCYGETWTDLAVVLLLPLAGLVFLGDLVVAVVLLVLRRPATLAPILGCAIQGTLLATAFVLVYAV